MSLVSHEIGSSPLRTDALEKVTGRAIYVDDIVLAGMLHGVTKRSTIPRGKIVSITLDPKFDWSDVTVVKAEDIPGRNVLAMIDDDQPILASKEVRHLHEPIALVAASELARAVDALDHIHITYDSKPMVTDPEDALEGRIKVGGVNNVFKEIEILKGEPETALEAAPLRLEEVFEVGHQEQLYIEPQGMIAEPHGEGGVRVTGSMQCPYYIHRALKVALGLDDDHLVRVIQAETGGGFGGKEDYPSMIAAHASLLALASGRPVKMIYSRKEDMEATTKRHPAEVALRVGADERGMLLALDAEVILDGGAYCTLSPVVLSRAVLHATSAYSVDHVRIRGRVVATNTPPNGAFRGFGAPQTIFACERMMDLLALRVGVSPAEIRRRNALQVGDSTCTGQVLSGSVTARDVLEDALDISGYERKRKAFQQSEDGRWRGMGVALWMHGCGFTGNGEKHLASRVRVGLRLDPDSPDGVRASIFTSSTEIGQGMRTTFRQIASETLGLAFESVVVERQDTGLAPDSGPTVASRTCMVVGELVHRAAARCREMVLADASPDDTLADGLMSGRFPTEGVSAEVEYEPPPGVEFDEVTYRGAAYPVYGYEATVVEVEVDPVTFEVQIRDVVTVADVGQPIHPVIVEGQIEGGTVQGLAYGYLETVAMVDGGMANGRMTDYIVPTACDMPRIRVRLHDAPWRGGPFGAKGVGEMPLDGAAPAVVSAISQALGGLPFRRAPLTPERILRMFLQNGGAI